MSNETPSAMWPVLVFPLACFVMLAWYGVSPDTMWLGWAATSALVALGRPVVVPWLRWAMTPIIWSCVLATGLSIGVAVSRWMNDTPTPIEQQERDRLVEAASAELQAARAGLAQGGASYITAADALKRADEHIKQMETIAPNDARTAPLRAEWADLAPVTQALGKLGFIANGIANDPASRATVEAWAATVEEARQALAGLPADHAAKPERALQFINELDTAAVPLIEARAVARERCGKPIVDTKVFQKAVEARAHDPNSVQFGGCTTPDVGKRHCWRSTCTFRAKNLLGALVLSEVTFEVKDGEIIDIIGP